MQASTPLRLSRAAYTALDHAARRPAPRLFWFSLCALAALWRALGDAGRLNDFYDAHLLLAYEEHAVRTVLEHGRLPWWDPYSCGGLYSLGNPQTRWAAPTFLLSLVFGSARAVPLITFLLIVVGAEGLFRYIRLRTPAPGLAMLLAPACMLIGYLARSYYFGWVQFFGLAFLPWVLHGTHRALAGDVVGHAVASLAFGCLVGFGGTYLGPFTALFVVAEALAVMPGERRWRPWGIWAARAAALAALLLALAWFRLGPIIGEMARAPRIMAGAPGSSLGAIAAMVFGRLPDDPTGLPPGRIYVGMPVLLGFAALGVLRSRTWVKGVILLLCVLAATGYHYGAGPFVWLRELPVFATLRYPERLLVVGALFLYELAVSGVFLGAWLARRRPWLWVPVLLAAAVMVVSVGVQARRFERLTRHMSYVPMPLEIAQPFQQARGNRWAAGYLSYQSRGSISCGEAYPVPMSTELRGDLPADEYLLDPEAGSLRRLQWSPSRLTLEAELARPTTVRLNQNYHPGWRSDVGTLRDDHGLIAVDLPAGRHVVGLSFLPRSGVVGMATSLAGVLALAAVLLLRRRRLGEARALMVMVALPAVAFALAHAGAPVDPPSPPGPTNADGSPLLVDALPADAMRVDVAFAHPVELLGGRFAPIGRDGMLHGELYFRVTGRVPRAVGVFVHIEREGRLERHADHEVIGGTYFLSNAPRGVILRDAFTVAFGDKSDARWEIYAGLWNVSSDRRRVPIASSGEGAHLSFDRVLVRRAGPAPP